MSSSLLKNVHTPYVFNMKVLTGFVWEQFAMFDMT